MTDDQAAVEREVSLALNAFRAGREAMARHFGAASAAHFLRAVLDGARPREGTTSEGLEYFVHGVGYTITLADGGEVHLDAERSGGECFKAYDICLYLETAGHVACPDAAPVRAELRRRAQRGELVAVDHGAYLLPEGPAATRG
ncbi:DUF6896 domain-containing protein [Streptomyces triticirhizae]|uniref:DUF6896 domain-containing protein n=1 Tax=Streptomyces triticirhizae TaxID=2483353 RepID=A0A3M2ME94_9ACTN|nr:hypothetical protein [Streptomyces triticirhizae]RMI45548.1 hypothetical protein EBN88_02860 [Streptomyces triticirhizae]